MARHLAVSTALITVASWAACGGANSIRSGADYEVPSGPPVALEVDQVFFIPGEQLSWDISLRDVVGGKAVLAVGMPGEMNGKSVVIIRSQVSSAGVLKLIKDVRDDVTSWIDVGDGRPLKHEAELKFGEKESKVQTQFSENGYVVDFERLGRTRYRKAQTMPEGEVAHDGHSILGVLRAWEPADGARAYFYVLSGRRLWRNDVVFAGRETIKTAYGTTAAIRIDGVATRLTYKLVPDRRKKRRHFTLWISDDANRLPVKVTARTEYGDVEVELTDYERPARHIVLK